MFRGRVRCSPGPPGETGPVPVPHAAVEDTAVEDTERWFIDRACPTSSAATACLGDVFTRVLPVLTAIFLLEMLGALNFTWAAWVNVLAAAGGFGLLLGVWVVANMLRDRPPLARPEQVGRIELVVFVLAPAALPLVFGGQLGSAAPHRRRQPHPPRHDLHRHELRPGAHDAVGRDLRGPAAGFLAQPVDPSAPVPLLFVTFLFIQTESWQVAGQLPDARFVALSLLFVAVGVLFVIALPSARSASSRTSSRGSWCASSQRGHRPSSSRRSTTPKHRSNAHPPAMGQRQPGGPGGDGRAGHLRQHHDRRLLRVVRHARRPRLDGGDVGRRRPGRPTSSARSPLPATATT